MSELATPNAVSVHSVVKHFGGVRALNGVDLTVGQGEIVGLVGPNGSGKSTLLSLISGIHRPTSGRIELLGRRLRDSSVRQVAKAGVARTFQTVRLWPSLTVEETIRVGAYLHVSKKDQRGRGRRWSGIAARGRLDDYEAEILSSLGLADVRSRRVGELSHGAQRHVEIARALARRPWLILLDEPAAGLSLDDRKSLRDAILTLPSRGISVLVVEHALDVILPVSDRVVVLTDGRKLFEGSPQDCMASPAVKSAYLGEQE